MDTKGGFFGNGEILSAISEPTEIKWFWNWLQVVKPSAAIASFTVTSDGCILGFWPSLNSKLKYLYLASGRKLFKPLQKDGNGLYSHL